jgi:phosphoglycolate phosphatase
MLVVCTNKPERHARRLLAALAIAPLFRTIAGIDTYAYCKPDGRHLTMAVDAAGGDARHAVMIGDSHVDVSAARNAGMPVICVSFGYTSVPVAALRPDRVIDRFSELVDAVDALARQGPARVAAS